MAIRPAGEFDTSYAADMSTIRRPWQWGLLLIALVVLYTLPFYGTKSLVALIGRITITIIAVQGLCILTGFSGQISLGQAAFMTTGGYISALLVDKLSWPFLLALPAAALGAGLAGLLFGLPSLRVKGFYLVMATLAAQFIIPWLTRNIFPSVLNGAQGLNVSPPVIFGMKLNTPEQYYYLTLSVLLVTTIITHNLTRSRLGRALVAIRDNDLAAEVLGVDPFKYKLQAFFLAAVFAGLAGALAAHQLRHINSETFDLVDSIIFMGMLVIGGLGSNLGPFFGAIVVEVLVELAVLVGPFFVRNFPGSAAGAVQALRPLFFGTSLMLFLIFEPRGLAYRWQVIKAAFRLRPFSH